jgi:hypothetical protein
MGNVTVLPLSGFVTTPLITSIAGSTPNFTAPFVGAMQTLPAAVTFTKMAGTLTIETPILLIGSTITITAQLYKYSNGSFTAIAGTACTFAPVLTGILGVGTTATCSVTGMSAAYSAGDAGFIVIGATAAGLSLVNNVSVAVSMGVQ